MNGGKLKNAEELKLEINENLNLKGVIKAASKKFLGNKDGHSKDAKIYDKNGVKLFGDDFNLIGNGDILYFASKGKSILKRDIIIKFKIGEDFNYCAILDDYELGRTLGQGGFGKVLLGTNRETKQEVAIKFLECGDQLSSAHQI